MTIRYSVNGAPVDPAFTSVKAWYCENYPDDELGCEINGTLSFSVLFKALTFRLDVYEILGVDDSIVRERVFQRLAAICLTDYDFVYELWLGITDASYRDKALAKLNDVQVKRILTVAEER